MSTHNPAVVHHFADAEQQYESATLGMWLFLLTELLLFGGLFISYSVYRNWYPEIFLHGSHELGINLGLTNTIVLICSSVTMAMAVHCAQTGDKKWLLRNLVFTIMFGATFLVVKGFEYHHHWVERKVPGFNFHFDDPIGNPQEVIFHCLYFIMTGIHGFHMVVGLVLLLTLLWMAWKNSFSPNYHTPVEMIGLYWHFVDLVWIFLFPLLYLTGNHVH